MEESLKLKESQAYDSLQKIMRSYRDHPINHNHYYTTTVRKIRHQREKARFTKAIDDATALKCVAESSSPTESNFEWIHELDKAKTLSALSVGTEVSQLLFSCEEALDCMYSIYKVKQKVFIDIVLTLVCEEHIFHDLENIFSPQ